VEFENARAGAEKKFFEALEAAEPHQATRALSDLILLLPSKEGDGGSPLKMWTRFKRLLHRRGYYVATPSQVKATLEEIAAVGEGFDLFDLARSLAAYDAARKGSRPDAPDAMPQLKRFAEAASRVELRKEE